MVIEFLRFRANFKIFEPVALVMVVRVVQSLDKINDI